MLTNKKRMLSLRLILPIFLILVSFVLCIGYATVSDTLLNVGGSAVAMMQKGVFVSDIQYKSGSGVNVDNSLLKVIRGTLLNSTVELSSTSSSSYITYTITVLNNDDYAYEFNRAFFDETFYDNSNIIIDLNNTILPGTILEKNSMISFDVTFKYKSGVTPSTLINKLNAYVNFEFVPIAVLNPTNSSDKRFFRNDNYLSKIKIINIERGINVPENAIVSWDVGFAENGNVMAYLVTNASDANYYDLYIQSDTQLYGAGYMGSYFRGFKSAEKINGLELLDTSRTTNMIHMFTYFGSDAQTVELDLNVLDTSNVTSMESMFNNFAVNSQNITLKFDQINTANVTNMVYMFYRAGRSSPSFSIDVSNFNTAKVTDMNGMFYDTGYTSTIFELDLSNFNTENVTNMYRMFYNAGYNSTSFTLDLSKFNTSKVTNMSYMFFGTGYKSKVFTLDVSSFDTSNVRNMSFMFYNAGYNSTIYDLDVSDFNTSKVTDMRLMFGSSGRNSSIFTLDVSGFNTSNVTDMHGMFSGTGYTNSSFTLDVSGFDTSKVTNMSSMFSSAGYNSTIFTLDVGDFDTSNVIEMNSMFESVGFSNTAFTLDVSNFDTSNVTNMKRMFYYTGHNSLVLHLDVSGFDTSNVTDMSWMFKWAGHENPNFELDVSNFNTSNVTDMAEMFRANGIRNPNFALDVSGFDTSKVTDMSWMFYFAGAINEDFVLDLGNWDTSSLVKTDSMFHGSLVRTIYASNKFVTSQITSSTNMFTGCSNLVGSSGTVYNYSLTDKSYARIDGGSSAPGYFSSKPEGYSMLSYLEGTGTQYIDTGYSAPEGFMAEAVIIYTNVSANYIVGSHNKSVPYGRNGISLNGSLKWEIGTGDDYTSASFGPSVNVKYRVAGSTVKGDSYINVDGTTVVSNNDTTDRSSYNLWVYHNQYSHNENMSAAYMKLFSLKIYDPSKNLIRDFVPCKNPSGEYGLYDWVTNQFYGNIGTGEFTGR